MTPDTVLAWARVGDPSLGEETVTSVLIAVPPLNRSPVDAFRRRTPSMPPPLLAPPPLSSFGLLFLRSRGAVDAMGTEGDGGLLVPCGVD
jgi:hypothetical protein